MLRQFNPEKGSMDIQGHHMVYEMVRSKEPSVFGIEQSRIFELNLWRDGTLTADYNRKWLKAPYPEDDASHMAIQTLIKDYGQVKQKKRKKG